MTKDEALDLALEALESAQGYIEAEHDDRKSLYEPYGMDYKYSTEAEDLHKNKEAITAMREALEQPAQKCSYPYCGCNSKAWCKVERNEALDKMAENARELGLDYEPVCNKDPQGCWSVRCQLGKKCKNTPAQQEPMDFNSLFHEAEEIVRQKPTWKRFIDGTPLSNDIAVWMTVFAQDVARRTSPPAQQEPVAKHYVDGGHLVYPPAQRTWVGLTDEEFISMVDSTGLVIDPELAFQIKEMVEAAHGIGEKK